MGEHCKPKPTSLTEYIDSIVKLNTLENMTQDLDRELEDSQRIMMEIRSLYDSVSTVQNNTEQPANASRHEDISNFLGAGSPGLLMPDMAVNVMEFDMDELIDVLKGYVEDLKHTLVGLERQPARRKGMVDLELDQFVQSLDQLSKNLSNIKLNKIDVKANTPEINAKMQLLFDDVEMSVKMIDAKKTLSLSNKNCPENREDDYDLQYTNVTKKLISDLNDMIYLLQRQN